MAIKGAIFDMDGTLTESMHLWIEIGRRYLEGLGYTVTPEQNKAMTQMLLEPMALYMQDEFGITKSQQQIIDEINKLVEPGYFEDVEVKPTVVETLEAMHDRGIKMCVAHVPDLRQGLRPSGHGPRGHVHLRRHLRLHPRREAVRLPRRRAAGPLVGEEAGPHPGDRGHLRRADGRFGS